VKGPRQKHIALILARELATQLATATFIADARGELVFYNEPAEEILGQTFAEAGSLPAESWTATFNLEHPDGTPMGLDEMPAGIALVERRPVHGKLRMTGFDGHKRLLSVTALPLFSSPTELVGMIALFWQEDDP
jgi:PAS domain-containing protein